MSQNIIYRFLFTWTTIANTFLDTDSIFFALSCPFSEIPKPETAAYYWEHVYPIWFFDAEKDNPDKARKPGVFKREFHVTNGSYVGLSSKV